MIKTFMEELEGKKYITNKYQLTGINETYPNSKDKILDSMVITKAIDVYKKEDIKQTFSKKKKDILEEIEKEKTKGDFILKSRKSIIKNDYYNDGLEKAKQTIEEHLK